MKKTLLVFIAFIICSQAIKAQNIQSPSEFLGYELGTRFTRNHQVVDYFKYVSEHTKTVEFKKYGETNEHRPLYLSYISSEENIQKLEIIREDNLKRTGILNGATTTEVGIVWLSYNVHGNEASSTEAAMLTLYKLITEKQNWLKNTLVIIDPSMNPDGRDRYVNWYNQTKNTPYNTNPDVTEHQEPWPGGRPNHYLFDLNRDWAWATQVETQQRLKVYNTWMPHIHVDFHEQYINNPYYFAPGAEPFHEIITDWQRDFQTEIGKNHAKYFDKEGWRYFTKESFDLFYPSYGDTYPTYMGAIGMTYEQAGHGMAGLGIVTENNTVLSLKDRIAHHTTTGLSTVEVASNNASKMIVEFGKFFDNSNLKDKSYILKGASEKINAVVQLLEKHNIISYFSSEKTINAFSYETGKNTKLTISENDLIVPTNQPKGKMVKVLFELEAKLSTPITYDITAWNIPLAYGLQGFSSEIAIQKTEKITKKSALIVANKKAYAYLNNWNTISDAAFLGDLLQSGFNVRFSNKELTVEGKEFKKGVLIIMRGENKHIKNFDETILKIATNNSQNLQSTLTGFSDKGPDFGSDYVKLIKNKKVAVLGGEGTSSLSFGEIWHFFETQLKYPLHILNASNFKQLDISKYHVLILPNGYIASEEALKKLTQFATFGGTIIAIESALKSFADKDGFSLKSKINEKAKDTLIENLTPYNQRESKHFDVEITGSILKSNIDNTHPLAFGYETNYYSLKLNSNAFKLLEKGVNVGYFPTKTTPISGYAGEEALENVSNSLLFGIENKGQGKVIYMADNPLFRSFWENGKLFFANAIFFN